jgi:hypothetical protein
MGKIVETGTEPYRLAHAKALKAAETEPKATQHSPAHDTHQAAGSRSRAFGPSVWLLWRLEVESGLCQEPLEGGWPVLQAP